MGVHNAAMWNRDVLTRRWNRHRQYFNIWGNGPLVWMTVIGILVVLVVGVGGYIFEVNELKTRRIQHHPMQNVSIGLVIFAALYSLGCCVIRLRQKFNATYAEAYIFERLDRLQPRHLTGLLIIRLPRAAFFGTRHHEFFGVSQSGGGSQKGSVKLDLPHGVPIATLPMGRMFALEPAKPTFTDKIPRELWNMEKRIEQHTKDSRATNENDFLKAIRENKAWIVIAAALVAIFINIGMSAPTA